MSHLSPEQKHKIIDDLAALDWVRPPSDLNERSTQLISERLGCAAEDANRVLERLQAQKLIEAVSESGGSPAHNRTLNSYGWRWIRK